ncbi:MAG: hypothetical protein J0I06_05600 [Planctomycetes bacterium]|nr:hypothetical protein [Planctomycetota bacterium]
MPEREEGWLLEVNLAERAALLLWRLRRLARYEAEAVAAAMDEVEAPALPVPEEPDPLFPKPAPPTREDQLRQIRDELRAARRELAEVVPARDFFVQEPVEGAAVPFAVAEGVLDAACGRAETAEGLRSDPPAFASKSFLRKLGLPGADAEMVDWTANPIRRGPLVYAGYTREPTKEFVEAVRSDLGSWADELDRKIRRPEREAGALVRFLDGRAERKRTAKLLPGDGRDERIAKYERHLHNLLTSTLHELERFQARRGGEAIPPPAVADVTVAVDPGPGRTSVGLLWQSGTAATTRAAGSGAATSPAALRFGYRVWLRIGPAPPLSAARPSAPERATSVRRSGVGTSGVPPDRTRPRPPT